MKEKFIKRLHDRLKEKYTSVGKNSNVRDSADNFTRKFSVKDNGVMIDFVIPKDGTNNAKIFFTNDQCRPTSILLELNVQTGDYTFSEIPSSKKDIKTLYLFAESYMEDIRYIANNALSFIMLKCPD